MSVVGELVRNTKEKFEIEMVELKNGSNVEIQINNIWLQGTIEYWQEAYYWISKIDGIAVILKNGIKARLPKLV